MLLDLYRYNVQALNFFPGKPLLAILPRYNHPLQPRLRTIAARPPVENRDPEPAAPIAAPTAQPKLQIGLSSPSTHRPVGMLPTASGPPWAGRTGGFRISLRSFDRSRSGTRSSRMRT